MLIYVAGGRARPILYKLNRINVQPEEILQSCMTPKEKVLLCGKIKPTSVHCSAYLLAHAVNRIADIIGEGFNQCELVQLPISSGIDIEVEGQYGIRVDFLKTYWRALRKTPTKWSALADGKILVATSAWGTTFLRTTYALKRRRGTPLPSPEPACNRLILAGTSCNTLAGAFHNIIDFNIRVCI
jgi:hypothetical protein